MFLGIKGEINMKRLICLLLVIVLAGSVVGCDSNHLIESKELFEDFNKINTIEDLLETFPNAIEDGADRYYIENYMFKNCEGKLVFYFVSMSGQMVLYSIGWQSNESLKNKDIKNCFNSVEKELTQEYGVPSISNASNNPNNISGMIWNTKSETFSLFPSSTDMNELPMVLYKNYIN